MLSNITPKFELIIMFSIHEIRRAHEWSANKLAASGRCMTGISRVTSAPGSGTHSSQGGLAPLMALVGCSAR